ncbi:unnamed protein product, partial [Choristocarpus tenellus]
HVETLLGRRRYLPQINSQDSQEKARAERQSINSICQGSAADLLKLAATNITTRLARCSWMCQASNDVEDHHQRLLSQMVAGVGGDNAEGQEIVTGWSSKEGEHIFAGTPSFFLDDHGHSSLVRNPPCRLILTIHDELLFEVR